MRVSLELVPRNTETLHRQLAEVRMTHPAVDTINVPQQPRFEVHALDGARIAQRYGHEAIPHVRSRDWNECEIPALARRLHEAAIKEVVVIAGDGTQPGGLYPPQLIKALKAERPIRIYVALDPWRNGPADELRGLEAKLAAGACGVFTQPFFDAAMMASWGNLLPPGLRVFWGIAPVLSEASMLHWQRMAGVRFPDGFQPTMEHNSLVARELVAIAGDRDDQVYHMPIRVDPVRWLNEVYGAAA